MIKQLILVCLSVALFGCGKAVTLRGEKMVGDDLKALLTGTTIHGMHGTQSTYFSKFTEEYNRDGTYVLTEPNSRKSTTRQDVKRHGQWEVRDDRVCYYMDDRDQPGCLFLYVDGDYIQYVSIGSGKVLAFSTSVEYGNVAAKGGPSVPPPAPSVASPTPAAPQPRKLEPDSTGTGFLVNTDAYVLTNQHVIDGCVEVRVRIGGRDLTAVVASQDRRNDLALLKLPSGEYPTAVFQQLDTLYPGDSVVALGYPLRGLLAAEASVSVGTVSARAGLLNDTTKLQITAPVQPGNSGGPLLDKSGLVVGIVVSSLDDKTAMEVLGVIPQNVNFAIKAGVAMALMQASDIRFTRAKSTESLSPADTARGAREFTVPIECWG